MGCHFLLQGIFLTRDQAHISCIGRWAPYHWATGKPLQRRMPCLFPLWWEQVLQRVQSVTGAYTSSAPALRWRLLYISKCTLANRAFSEGFTGTSRKRLGISLSFSQLRSRNQSPASFPFFSSLSPPGIFHQLESKDISRHADGWSRTFALGCGCIWWPVFVQQELKGYPARAALSSSPPSRLLLPCCLHTDFSRKISTVFPGSDPEIRRDCEELVLETFEYGWFKREFSLRSSPWTEFKWEKVATQENIHRDNITGRFLFKNQFFWQQQPSQQTPRGPKAKRSGPHEHGPCGWMPRVETEPRGWAPLIPQPWALQEES